MIRELTQYEKDKWIDFGMLSDEPLFLTNGDELGETFAHLLETEACGAYLSDEFVKAIQAEILDMYYYQIHLYTGEYGGDDQPEDLGLPHEDLFMEEARGLGFEDLDDVSNGAHLGQDEARELWDWAVEWCLEHEEETTLARQERRLKAELARIQSMKSGG